jgi:hypothetical protein
MNPNKSRAAAFLAAASLPADSSDNQTASQQPAVEGEDFELPEQGESGKACSLNDPGCEACQ